MVLSMRFVYFLNCPSGDTGVANGRIALLDKHRKVSEVTKPLGNY